VLNTKEIMDVALNLVGFTSVPEDSAIYVEGRGIKRVLFGIDADVPELLFAKKTKHDAVISHHPKGDAAIVNFHRVFSRHILQMVEAGVPRDVAERAVRRKLTTLEVENHTRNYGHSTDLAKLLGMPYMNIHTPLDELGRRKMTHVILEETDKNSTVGDVVSALKKLPEFKNAATDVKIRVGTASKPAGKIVVSHGAGTNGGYEIAKTYFQHGVDTLVYIHISPSDLERLRADDDGNIVVSGHVASDSVGINPFIEELENQGISVTRLGIVPP
jgi:putative NIF3 family GTP cyclohydrolase 1 type 2